MIKTKLLGLILLTFLCKLSFAQTDTSESSNVEEILDELEGSE